MKRRHNLEKQGQLSGVSGAWPDVPPAFHISRSPPLMGAATPLAGTQRRKAGLPSAVVYTSPPSAQPAFSQDSGASRKVKLGFGLQIQVQVFPGAVYICEHAEGAWGQETGFVGLVFKCLLRMC